MSLEYYRDIVKGDYVAVSKGKCDCAAPIDHPMVVLEQIIIRRETSFKTWNSEYSVENGDNLNGDGGEYDRILDPNESLDAMYLLLDFFVERSKLSVDNASSEEERTAHETANALLERELSIVTEKIINRI